MSIRRNALALLIGLLLPTTTLATNTDTVDDTPPFGPVASEQTPAPAGFSRFTLVNHDDAARILSQFLWYHFRNRLHTGRTVYYQEYLGLADMWLGGAIEKDSGLPIQQVHRRNLLSIQIDDTGYVHTHQHYSHAHEHGWPFPLWPQSAVGPDTLEGLTAGWHFQNDHDPGPWIWNYLKLWNLAQFYGDKAAASWTLEDCESIGIVDDKWRIKATGPSPVLVSPADVTIDAANAPFLQLRWRRSGEPPNHQLPYIEWRRSDDTGFSPDRRMYLHSRVEEHADVTDSTHTMIPVYRHPLWSGTIERIRLCLAPGEPDVQLDIDSFFTVYDTRHPINNPVFVLASANYLNWTRDLDFLRRNINRMRIAMRYMMTEMGGLEHRLILVRWPGHDGQPGWTRDPDDNLTLHPGHGIGNNYFDLIPFGWKDCYITTLYYGALVQMATIEQAIREHPGWNIPCGALALDPRNLNQHAADVKQTGNRTFWNKETGRLVGCIDRAGNIHDYGFTWLALEAIWHDFATPEHARQMMDWIAGRRIVAGDTSTGSDIYRWRFGPRTTTLRNVEWYGQCWYHPASLPFGGQVQDGGAVLGFTFYDLYARLRTNSPDDAWQRLQQIIDWERDVWSAGGYRPFYAAGKQGTTLQGGGTAGGIGIDYEFFESSLVPAIIVYGFLGLQPHPDALRIAPALPAACPQITVHNVRYANTTLDVSATSDIVTISVHSNPPNAIAIEFAQDRTNLVTGRQDTRFQLSKAGTYSFQQLATAGD